MCQVGRVPVPHTNDLSFSRIALGSLHFAEFEGKSTHP